MQAKLLIKSFSAAVFFFAAAIGAQQKNGTDHIVFGKTYTKEEVKKMGGVIRCATTEYEQYLQNKYPGRMTDAEFEAWIAPFVERAKESSKSQNGTIITIPVVVHVIHAGQPVGIAPNITDSQVQSQITVMTQDFRKMAGTPGYNTNTVGADTQIQFALAKVDPNGNPTNGVDRINMCQDSWSMDDIDNIVKPQTIWDPTQYMNMWSINFADSSLLGYAQFPSGSGLSGLNSNNGPANTDGVVAGYKFFGTSALNDGTFLLAAPYDKGRTMTHEVGHFFGLRHIWGDDSSATACATDYCNDTPPAHEANYTCDTAIASCTAGLFEMVQNYMDYTPDGCMNIFTVDQAARFTAVMNNSPRRASLKTSNKDIAIPLFPLDGEIKVENSCGGTVSCSPSSLKFTLYNRGTSTLTSATISYTVGSGGPQTYNWTGSLTQDKLSTFAVPVNAGASGAVSASIVSVNGTSDQRASNNSANGTFTPSTLPPNYAFNAVKFDLQDDPYGVETTWTLKNSAGTILYQGGPYSTTYPAMPALVSQTWNLPSNDCYTFTINDAYGDGICCTEGAGYYTISDVSGGTVIHTGGDFGSGESVSFRINALGTKEASANAAFSVFPNPAADILNVTKVSAKAQFQIFDESGRLVKKGNIADHKIDISALIKGNYIISVSDQEISGNVKFIKK